MMQSKIVVAAQLKLAEVGAGGREWSQGSAEFIIHVLNPGDQISAGAIKIVPAPALIPLPPALLLFLSGLFLLSVSSMRTGKTKGGF